MAVRSAPLLLLLAVALALAEVALDLCEEEEEEVESAPVPLRRMALRWGGAKAVISFFVRDEWVGRDRNEWKRIET